MPHQAYQSQELVPHSQPICETGLRTRNPGTSLSYSRHPANKKTSVRNISSMKARDNIALCKTIQLACSREHTHHDEETPSFPPASELPNMQALVSLRCRVQCSTFNTDGGVPRLWLPISSQHTLQCKGGGQIIHSLSRQSRFIILARRLTRRTSKDTDFLTSCQIYWLPAYAVRRGS